MPALPVLRQKAVEAIGEALSKQDIVRLVKAATGKDIFNIYADESDPRAVAISKTLAQLEKEGTERWLLTYVLIAIAEQKLRTLIVKTWPNTLVSLPQAGGQVDNALKYSRENPAIEVTLTTLPRDILELKVADNGIGIAKSRALKETSEHKSHGMALIIKRMAALGHFGKQPITINMYPAFDNDKNPGNKITIFIPDGLHKAWLNAQQK